HFVCLTAKEQSTILCLLATLPAGFDRLNIISRIRAFPSEEQSCVVYYSSLSRSGRMICPHKVGQLVKQFL
ncbi:hypothetical protein, partial [Acinetobacter baumannii]|uniref:hypothetical protein n=1 Tax=Acinetobacter baumannii TaxID=470 RepID=UPI00196B6359